MITSPLAPRRRGVLPAWRAVRLALGLIAAAVLVPCSCTAPPPAAPTSQATVQEGISPLETQALVMSMADEYIASIGEAVYLLTRDEELSPRGRTLALSFLRNGVGASLDIGASPNPPVGLLDLLVLVSLQTWSFEANWMPAGIGDAGGRTLQRLRQTEAELWAMARRALTDDQLLTLRELIDAWIAAHPDRIVVSLVRFEEFANERKMSGLQMRGQAIGLLRDVRDATGAIDDARLLGERLIWYAGRFPYLLGEQAELTAYRLMDQPEGQQLTETMESIEAMAAAISEQMDTISADLTAQQAAFFELVAAERTRAIEQARQALDSTVQVSLDDATNRINAERVAAIDQAFDRIALERSLFLDDLASRQGELRGLMTDLRQTISASGTLAHELTGTVEAIDRVVSRFDVDPDSQREPLSMTDIRDAAIETTRAAHEMTRVLELSNELVASRAWDERFAGMTGPADTILDRAFWRGAILIGVLIAGLALIRFLPRRDSEKSAT